MCTENQKRFVVFRLADDGKNHVRLDVDASTGRADVREYHDEKEAVAAAERCVRRYAHPYGVYALHAVSRFAHPPIHTVYTNRDEA